MTIKTSTRVSLIFSIFTFIIILLLLIILNVFFFLSWYDWEKKEIEDISSITSILNDWYKEVIKEELMQNKDDNLIKELLSFDIFDWKKMSWYERKFFHIYEKNEDFYLILKDTNWIYSTPYNITKYIQEQLKIIKIWITLLIIFTLISFFLSKKLFIKLALKDIFYISKKLKKIDLNDIKNINLDLHKNDEINIILNSLNIFLEIIDKNNKSLKQFNSQVAHELKTPLMIISSELEFLQLKWENSDSMKKIELQILKLDNLLEQFLLLTKISNWKKIKKENVNLKEIANKYILSLKNIYKKKDIKIINNIDSKILLNTNKDFFWILLKNILDNAFKYNKQKWKIILSFEGEILKIEDTWKWIKKENLEKIWDNLYRENEFWNGYWIWLNLVKKISEVLNYEINVESKEDIWTTFLLKIK